MKSMRPLLIALLTLSIGCSGGGGDGGISTGTGSGPGGGPAPVATELVSVALTDAPGAGITAFIADVTSVTLRKASGVVVSVLPARTTVNFAELDQLSELVSAGQVPTGAYESLSLDLDFTGANAAVTLASGASTAAGTVVLKDEQGNPLTKLTVDVKLEDGRPVSVRSGAPSHVTLDFDLEQSCVIDESVTPAVVTVRPVFAADAEHRRPVPARLRGTLGSVDAAAKTFVLALRPHLAAATGEVTVATDAGTAFDGEDLDHDGSLGIADLAAAAAGTTVLVHGRFDPSAHRFVAESVQYGAGVPGVPGTARDCVEGDVVDFSGTTFTLAGAVIARASGGVTFNATVSALIDATTPIRRPGIAAALAPADIGIGQRLALAGALSGTAPGFSIDCTSASTGVARLLPTAVSGIAHAPGGGKILLDVKAFGRRPVRAFDLVGHGLDPASYPVGTGTINLSEIADGDAVQCRGFVTPGGATAFAATAVAARPPEVLFVRWPLGTRTPFNPAPSAFPATVDLAGAGVAFVTAPGRFTSLSAGPTLALGSSAAGAGVPRGPFVLHGGRAVSVFGGDGSAAWLADLAARLAGGRVVLGLTALGRHDGATGTFTVQTVAVHVR